MPAMACLLAPEGFSEPRDYRGGQVVVFFMPEARSLFDHGFGREPLLRVPIEVEHLQGIAQAEYGSLGNDLRGLAAP